MRMRMRMRINEPNYTQIFVRVTYHVHRNSAICLKDVQGVQLSPLFCCGRQWATRMMSLTLFDWLDVV